MKSGRWILLGWLGTWLCGIGSDAAIQAVTPGSAGLWRLRSDWEAVQPGEALRLRPGAGAVFEVDEQVLQTLLSQAPEELGPWAAKAPILLALPQPDGSTVRAWCVASPVMEPALALRYPELRTYRLRGLDDPGLTGRLSLTPQGVHARWRAGRGWMVLEPLPAMGPVLHRVYARTDLEAAAGDWICETPVPPLAAASSGYGPTTNGGILRV